MTAAILIGIVIAAVTAIIVGVSVATSRKQRAISAAVARVAAEFDDGEFVIDRWGHRLVRFTHHGQVVEFELGSVVRNQYYGPRVADAELRIAWPDRHIKLRIQHRHTLNIVQAFFLRSRVLTGIEAFDNRLTMTGSPRDQVSELVTPAVPAILGLVTGLANRPLEIHISDGGARIRTVLGGSGFSDYQQFVDLSLQVIDGLTTISTKGVEFIEGDSSDTATDVVCRICGDPLDQMTVQCASCKTLHHHECWAYAGGCSTYGCGQTKYLSVPTPLTNLHESADQNSEHEPPRAKPET